MANASTECSSTMSSMLQWGLLDLLGAQDFRQLRLVCRELQHAVDAANGTLVLPLKSANCNDADTAVDVALFHSRNATAKQLLVCLEYSAEADEQAAVKFMAAYTAQCKRIADTGTTANCSGTGLPAVKHCRIEFKESCDADFKPVLGVSDVLPSLESLALAHEPLGAKTIPVGRYYSVSCMLSRLQACKHLHTLVLDAAFCRGSHGVFSYCSNLALTRVTLPHLCTLHAVGSTPQESDTLSLPCTMWHPGMATYIQDASLATFPALQHLQGLMIQTCNADFLPKIADALQRMASSAEHWAWDISADLLCLGGLPQHMPPGCLSGLRNIRLHTNLSDRGTATLACIVTAAPRMENVCLLVYGEVTAENILAVLQPLQHAAHMHSLWISIGTMKMVEWFVGESRHNEWQEDPHLATQVLAAAARFLHGGSGSMNHCPSLKRLAVGSLEGGDWFPEDALEF